MRFWSGSQKPAHLGAQILQIERLGNEPVGPEFLAFAVLDRRTPRGHHQHLDVRQDGVAANVPAYLITRNLGQHHVQQDKVRPKAFDAKQGFRARGDTLVAVTLLQDKEFKCGGNVVVVLDDKDKRRKVRMGDTRGHHQRRLVRWGLVRTAVIGAGSKDGGPDLIDLIQTQLVDPFRFGLIVALVFTMYRTRAATGTVVPLAAGVVFVSVILAATMPTTASGMTKAVLAGLVSNLIFLGIVLALAVLVRRLRA